MMALFGGYGFNKAHSAAYAVIAAQTAYLKAHYPGRVHVRAHDNRRRQSRSTRFRRRACASHTDTKCLARMSMPASSISNLRFADDGKEAIRFGLAAIKNVGKGAAESILQARRGFADPANSRASMTSALRSTGARSRARWPIHLARSGALDCFGPRSVVHEPARTCNLWRHRPAARRRQGSAWIRHAGQPGSRSRTEPTQMVTKNIELPLKQRLAWERELLGIYLERPSGQ